MQTMTYAEFKKSRSKSAFREAIEQEKFHLETQNMLETIRRERGDKYVEEHILGPINQAFAPYEQALAAKHKHGDHCHCQNPVQLKLTEADREEIMHSKHPAAEWLRLQMMES